MRINTRKMKRLTIIMATCLALVLMAGSAMATIYHVSPNGNDSTGDGSAAKPWKTLASAAEQVRAGEGHVIRLAAGTFNETRTANIPVGVTVEGAGKDRTIIKSSLGGWLINLSSNSFENGNQSLRGFRIDGNSRQLDHGILVSRRHNVKIHDLHIQGIEDVGIQVQGQGSNLTSPPAQWVNNLEIYRVTLVNTSKDFPERKHSSGAIMLGHVSNAKIHDNIIRENQGYGIKFLNDGWIRRSQIYNNDIVVPTVDQSWTCDIAIELWNITEDCKVYDNKANSWFSFVRGNKGSGTRSLHVYNNHISFPNLSSTMMAIEIASLSDVEINNNFIQRGRFGIGLWKQRPDAPANVANIKIHHNVIVDNPGGHGIMMTGADSNIQNVQVYNNVIDGQKSAITMNPPNAGARINNVHIANNVFMNGERALSTMGAGGNITKITMQQNVMHRVSTNFVEWGGKTGTTLGTNFSQDPQLTGEGVKPYPFYKPASDKSFVVNRGIDVGLPFSGGAPSIGAYDYAHVAPPSNLRVIKVTP